MITKVAHSKKKISLNKMTLGGDLHAPFFPSQNQTPFRNESD